MKVPPHQYDATVAFYRDILGFPLLEEFAPSVVVEFGPNRLWIDRVPTASQAELWLEVVTDDVDAAARRFTAAGVTRCDEIEPLREGFAGFWIASPASVVHLVCTPEDA
ncbi:MAG: VOC family protein [Dehalococcoidia bacterium]